MSRAEIAWTKDGQSRKTRAMIEDRSDSGMGIRVPVAIAAGTAVTVMRHEEILSGTVRHCVRDDLEYLIGVDFATSVNVQQQTSEPATSEPPGES